MIKYIFLGVVQGLTEFLPVSSSGHLIVIQKLLGVKGNEVGVSLILHLGTSLALLIFFFKDILRVIRDTKMLALIIAVTLITGAIGLSGKDFFEGLFSSVRAVAFAWIVTGGVLLLTMRFMDAKRKDIKLKDAVILGIMQGIAIIPGISRSGITISTLLFRKIDRDLCFKFSFLVSLPVILGAALLEIKKINSALMLGLKDCAAGFVSSFFAGLIALWILKLVLHKARFYYFGYYCIIIAILTLLFIK